VNVASATSIQPSSILAIHKLTDKGSTNHLKATYNDETPLVIDGKDLGITIEGIAAGIFVCMIASVPLVIACLEAKPTRTDIVQSVVLLLWLVSCVYLFTHVVKFQSVHFVGQRPLTLVETIYLMAQVLTTVGHGDILPADATAQVVVGLYVLFTILLIADMISAVIHLAIARTREYTKELAFFSQERLEEVASCSVSSSGNHGIQLCHHRNASLPWRKFLKTLAAFLLLVLVGVLFYHYYPGENKTWWQGTYMSIITLTTVGFGSELPATEAGKVFGSFWMLFGVVSLLSLVSGLTELMLAIKAREQWSQEEAKLEIERLRKRLSLSTENSKNLMVSRHEFLRFALVHSTMIGREELEKIDTTFQAFGPNEDDDVPLELIERAIVFGRHDTIDYATKR